MTVSNNLDRECIVIHLKDKDLKPEYIPEKTTLMNFALNRYAIIKNDVLDNKNPYNDVEITIKELRHDDISTNTNQETKKSKLIDILYLDNPSDQIEFKEDEEALQIFKKSILQYTNNFLDITEDYGIDKRIFYTEISVFMSLLSVFVGIFVYRLSTQSETSK